MKALQTPLQIFPAAALEVNKPNNNSIMKISALYFRSKPPLPLGR